MKRLTQGLLMGVVALALTASPLAYNGSYSPGEGINNTPHDLSKPANGMNYAAVPADPLNRVCVFCHAPHNAYRLSTAAGTGAGPVAPEAYDYLPLWNHALPEANPVYTMYENGPGAPTVGPKSSQAIANGQTPGSTSLLCLSCHDGVIAVNEYGNADQPTLSSSHGSTRMSPAYQVGADMYLGNHHPVGFNYDDAQLMDPELRSADAAMMTPTTFVRDHLSGEGSANMECATCHSVHNKGNTGEKLLWRSDQNSELCLTCHDKGIYTAP